MLYSFRAKNLKGEETGGEREARDEATLARSLRKEGYILIESKSQGEAKRKGAIIISLDSFLRRVSLQDKMIFARHLSVMIDAGLSLTRALDVLKKQTINPYFKKVLSGVVSGVTKGESFADSVAKYPKVFDELFVNMIRVGEAGGNLEDVLKTLAHQMEKDHELRSKVKGAFMYPAVIVGAMVLIGIIMMIFVVPKLTATFADLKIDLPITTQFVILVSNFLAEHTLIFLGGLAGFIYGFMRLIKTKTGKRRVDFLVLRMPIIKGIVTKVNTARMARSLSSLLKSGVSIAEAIEMVSKTLSNHYFADALALSADKVRKGKSFSKVLEGYDKIYPPIVTQMIAVGEETGTVDDILSRLADFYEEEVYNITKNLSTIIEPILMIFIGAAVGFFAISMLQPMYSIVEGI